MPEGHTVHRLARQHLALFAGTVVRASSPQGRFTGGAEVLDGRRLVGTEAYGKHLLHHYEPRDDAGAILHVHLGLYGAFTTGQTPPPAPRGALRLRLANDEWWTDLRGPTACELFDRLAREQLLSRLGPDPLRDDADPVLAYERIRASRTPVAALLMDQRVVAGIGNVYRAEILFRHRISPFRPGRDLTPEQWSPLWRDLRTLMRAGVRSGYIATTRPEHRVRRRGTPTREDRFYVYRRTGLPCRICSTEIRRQELAGRNLYWCPRCQAA
jgi:DNA-formamidopyrimidine glycosylase